MRKSLLLFLIFNLLTSCSDENQDIKPVVKVYPDNVGKKSKIIITNYEYFNTYNNLIHIYTKKENHRYRYDKEFFGDLKRSIELIFDTKLNAYTYGGEIVTRIDLNCGSPFDDIDFQEEDITYNPYQDEIQILIKDYKNIRNERFYSIIDPTGIHQGMKNAIVQTYRNDKNIEIININIMPWGSEHANLDGKNHFFDNKLSIKVKLYNMYSISNDNNITNNVIIKYDDDSYIDIYKDSAINKQFNDYYVGKRRIKRINFNKGSSGDDLNFSASSNPGVVEYIAKYSEYPTPIIDSNIGFIFGTVDGDGINRISKNAEIRAFVKNNKELIIEVYK